MNRDTMFVVLVMFWTFVIILSNVLYDDQDILIGSTSELLPNSDADNDDKGLLVSFLDGVFDFGDKMPIVNVFVPLMRMLTFTYTSDLPALVLVFLNATGIFTAYIVWQMLRGN